MRHLSAALSCLLFAACSTTDPCDGHTGGCISARIEGSATGLDQLRITLDALSLESVLSPEPASAFSLPVRVGIGLPAAAPSSFHVTIDGLAGGAIVASTGPSEVTLPASGRAAFTFSLEAGTGDAGAGRQDAASDGGGDMSNPFVGVTPSTQTFVPVKSGMMGATVDFTVTDNSSGMLEVLGAEIGAGSNSFAVAHDGCRSTNLTSLGSCSVSIQFVPQAAGSLAAQLEVRDHHRGHGHCRTDRHGTQLIHSSCRSLARVSGIIKSRQS